MDRRELEYALTAPEDRIEFLLGAADFYETPRGGKKYSIDYRARGAEVFKRLRASLAAQLCDSATGELRPWVALAAEGDARELAVVLITIASTSAGLGAAVAVPFAALLARRGLRGICSEGAVSAGKPTSGGAASARRRRSPTKKK